MSVRGISPKQRERIMERDNHKCQYCGYDLFKDASLANYAYSLCVDHITAIASGGSRTDPSNLVTACGECNAYAYDLAFGSFEEKKDFILRRRIELRKPIYWFIEKDAA